MIQCDLPFDLVLVDTIVVCSRSTTSFKCGAIKKSNFTNHNAMADDVWGIDAKLAIISSKS